MFNESNTIELKSKLIDEVKNEIVAFLNTKGGKVYVGVNDDGSINESFLKEDRDDISFKNFVLASRSFLSTPFKSCLF